jgi:hypothetical protein
MRLMEVIFDWTPTVPQWVKDAKARAAQIVKAWKSRQVELFEMIKTKAKTATWHQLNLVLFPDAPEQATAQEKQPEIFPPEGYYASQRWSPCFTTDKADWSWATTPGEEWLESMGGVYVSYCRRHQGGFQSHAGSKQRVGGYGFSI